jgi:hypothetical protein
LGVVGPPWLAGRDILALDTFPSDYPSSNSLVIVGYGASAVE